MESNIYLSKDEFLEAKNFLIQYLRDSGFDGSLEDGTGLHDLVIKAFALYYTLYKKQAEKVKAYMSINDALAMQDTLDDEFDSAVDSILTNWFVQRKEGVNTKGFIRLWFSRPLPYLRFELGTPVCTINSFKFVSNRDEPFVEDDFKSLANSINNNASQGTVTEYFIDIEVVSEDKIDFTPVGTELINATPNSIYYTRATFASTFSNGFSKESTIDFITRTSKAITTRELITDNAIYTVLMDKIPGIYDVYSAGYGSKEQLRDQATFSGTTVRIGNKCDIYISGEVTKSKAILTVAADSTINLGTLGTKFHICGIQSCSIAAGNSRAATPFTINNTVETTFGSCGAVFKLNVPHARQNERIEVSYYSMPSVVQAHEYVKDSENKVVCYDPMVKSKFVLLLRYTIRVKTKLVDMEDKISSKVKTGVQDYLILLSKQKEKYKESELIAFLHAVVPEAYAFEVPLQTTYTVIDPKAKIIRTDRFPDYFSSGVIGFSSKQFTDNTFMLFSEPDLVDVIVTQVS